MRQAADKVICPRRHSRGACFGPAGVLALLGLCGGASGFLAAGCDATHLAALPLLAGYAAMAALLRLHLRCLAASWRLLRGKVKCGTC